MAPRQRATAKPKGVLATAAGAGGATEALRAGDVRGVRETMTAAELVADTITNRATIEVECRTIARCGYDLAVVNVLGPSDGAGRGKNTEPRPAGEGAHETHGHVAMVRVLGDASDEALERANGSTVVVPKHGEQAEQAQKAWLSTASAADALSRFGSSDAVHAAVVRAGFASEGPGREPRLRVVASPDAANATHTTRRITSRTGNHRGGAAVRTSPSRGGGHASAAARPGRSAAATRPFDPSCVQSVLAFLAEEDDD